MAKLVGAGGDATELFDLVEKAFDAVALAVERRVAGEFLAPRGDRRNDRFDAIGGRAFANAVRSIAFVARGGVVAETGRKGETEFEFPPRAE